MKKINCTLTKNEQRALEAIMFDAQPCRAGCVFEEMKTEKVDCLGCPYTKAFWSLMEKLGLEDNSADAIMQLQS